MEPDVLNDPREHANLLILEVGNSHISVATSIGRDIRTNHRFTLDDHDGVLRCADQSWEALPADRLRGVAAGSVVPDVFAHLRRRVADRLDAPILAVGDELQRPIEMQVEAPEKVGVDRLCSAAACYEQLESACVVASFGTAITIDCISADGVFLGGAILPGFDLQARALAEGTAALPRVKVRPAHSVFGRSTEQAICNGILYGAAGALREITERYATELGRWPQLVATGGGAELMRPYCEFIDNFVPDLCVRGIGLAYRRHFGPMRDAP